MIFPRMSHTNFLNLCFMASHLGTSSSFTVFQVLVNVVTCSVFSHWQKFYQADSMMLALYVLSMSNLDQWVTMSSTPIQRLSFNQLNLKRNCVSNFYSFSIFICLVSTAFSQSRNLSLIILAVLFYSFLTIENTVGQQMGHESFWAHKLTMRLMHIFCR